MIAWPLHIPKELVRAYSEDGNLYVLVNDEGGQKAATATFERWGIKMDNMRFLVIPQALDAQWPRDWGPHAVFTEDGEFRIGCPVYKNSTPNTNTDRFGTMYNPYDEYFEEARADVVDGQLPDTGELHGQELTPVENESASRFADLMGLEKINLGIALTGGNMFSDGRGNMISSYALVNENRYNGISDREFFATCARELGMVSYSLISNYEDMGIQHVDCLFKLCDEETILMTRAPEGHPLHDRYERIYEEDIKKLRTSSGRPFKVFRIDAGTFKNVYGEDTLTAYANSIIVNGNVYVPQYGIAQDKVALQQWQEAMPGYHIRGFLYELANCEPEENLGVYGDQSTLWACFDAVHCRTRAVWDPEMLYISVWRLHDDVVEENGGYPVYADIVAYSGKGLIADKLQISWKLKGDDAWKRTPLAPCPIQDRYRGVIPHAETGATIEYFISAADGSGRSETMPRVAPEGFYTYTV